MDQKSDQYFINCFLSVAKDGLTIDGKHVTINNNGVSYDYIAYKNKMLQIYPETLFDVQLVRDGDKFNFSKSSGEIQYSHDMNNPFDDTEVIGAYCIIKNKRGQFLTTLSRKEIDKHRKVAKTDYVWKNWFDEMSLKTVIKKACKTHFEDIYSNMEELDNTQYELENVNKEAQEKESYPEEKFKENFPKWEELVKSGKKKPMAIITQMTNSFNLNSEQIATIETLNDIELTGEE